jgi:hypothetical protein
MLKNHLALNLGDSRNERVFQEKKCSEPYTYLNVHDTNDCRKKSRLYRGTLTESSFHKVG